MSKVRVHISTSLDGYVAGPNQSQEEPLGEGGEGLHEWVVSTKSWREAVGMEGGEDNISSAVVDEEKANVGAEIMGRGKFGPATRGSWGDEPWRGWWGDDPPFHKPVFVLTHHEREPLILTDTTFTFVTDGIEFGPGAGARGRRRQGRLHRWWRGRHQPVPGGRRRGRDRTAHRADPPWRRRAPVRRRRTEREAGGDPGDRRARGCPPQIPRRPVSTASASRAPVRRIAGCSRPRGRCTRHRAGSGPSAGGCPLPGSPCRRRAP